MTWKDGGDSGRVCRRITDEADTYDICRVWIRREVFSNDEGTYKWNIEPWPEGEANFRLVLAAPPMLEALEEIAALETPRWPSLAEVADIYEQSIKIARAAIAAVKGGEKKCG